MSYSNALYEFNFNAKHLEDGFYAVPMWAVQVIEGSESGSYTFEVDEDGDEAIPDDFVFLSDDEDEAAAILALRLELDDFRSYMTIDHGIVSLGRDTQYLALTDDEADDAVDERLEEYIDDCLEIPDHLASYFDRDAWKRDARMDGRGHTLATYDGHELYQDVTLPSGHVETIYLYRQ